MKVVLFCGGLGTRIREYSENIPKPMVPVCNQPILLHLMEYYSQYGHKDFVLCLGYKANIVKEFFLNYRAATTDVTVTLGSHDGIVFHGNHSEEDWKVTLAETGEDTMTGGRVAAIRRYV